MKKTFLQFMCATLALFVFVQTGYSATVQELQGKIDNTLIQKQQLEEEIARYEAELKTIGQQANSLASEIKSFDATIAKNTANIKLTENNIQTAELDIERLSLDIGKSVIAINEGTSAIAEIVKEADRADRTTFIENLLTHKTLSDFWSDMAHIYALQKQLQIKVSDTKDTKRVLETTKSATEIKHEELLRLKVNLQDQKKVLELSRAAKDKTLRETQANQKLWEQQLAERKAKAAAFDRELIEFQSALRLAIDPTSYPSGGKGILLWPLDTIKITQRFGVTDFSKTTNAYNGQGHNGVDFGAPIGTPIKAALSGKVIGTGDTDLVCPGASFGRWVFIEHDNGLSTIYAHLSLIKAVAGQRVTTGEIIGYTGNTGFSTGPHLHFGLYASQGVKILSQRSRVCGGTYTMPVADLRAYLDPLQYL